VTVNPPVLQRLELLFGNMMKSIDKTGSAKHKRLSWVLKAVFDEMADDMLDQDVETLEQWLAATGQVIKWIGTGRIDDLPEQFHDMVPEHLALMSKPVLELEASSESTA
jgi:hypothetical protein